MNNGLSLNKQNNNNNTNYFNKTTKNFTNKNQNNINLKLSFNIIKKQIKFFFQDKMNLYKIRYYKNFIINQKKDCRYSQLS